MQYLHCNQRPLNSILLFPDTSKITNTVNHNHYTVFYCRYFLLSLIVARVKFEPKSSSSHESSSSQFFFHIFFPIISCDYTVNITVLTSEVSKAFLRLIMPPFRAMRYFKNLGQICSVKSVHEGKIHWIS